MKRPVPKNGWMVMCLMLNSYQICLNEDSLANEVHRLREELIKKCPDGIYGHVAIWELGERVSVRYEPKITSIDLVNPEPAQETT